ncbi:MAG: HAD family hydrolase [Planctomycetota bacterium]
MVVKFEAVALDIGRVVLDFDFAPMLEMVAPRAGRSNEEIVALFRSTDVQDTFERGKVSPREFFAFVTEALSLEMSEAEFTRAWNGIFTEVEGMVEILDELAPKIRLLGATNTNELHLAHIMATYPVLGRFESIVSSCEVGARKPEKEFYLEVIARAGSSPEKIFFADDLEANVLGASRAGLEAFRFTKASALRSRLRGMGIL